MSASPKAQLKFILYYIRCLFTILFVYLNYNVLNTVAATLKNKLKMNGYRERYKNLDIICFEIY